MKEVENFLLELQDLVKNLFSAIKKDDSPAIINCTKFLKQKNSELYDFIIENRLTNTSLMPVYTNIEVKLFHLNTNMINGNIKGMYCNAETLEKILDYGFKNLKV